MSTTLTFKITTRALHHGHKVKSPRACYTIEMLEAGKVVGVEHSDSSAVFSYLSRRLARAAALRRVKFLRTRRLFVIPVDKWAIEHGEGHNCSTCAISQALWKNMERMGLNKDADDFRTSTYGAWTDADGITLKRRGPRGGEIMTHIPVKELPRVVTTVRRGGKPLTFNEDMVQWTKDFDDWYDSKFETLKEYRERNDETEGGKPRQPPPFSFVLDLDAFKPLAQ